MTMGDVAKGKKAFVQKCAQCHTVEEGGNIRSAPTCGVCSDARPARGWGTPTRTPTRAK
ncbi:hypothetical protein KUCAC02_031902, partial [Chaenocephalus aceratus]